MEINPKKAIEKIIKLPKRLFVFFTEIKTQMKLVDWPTKKETIRYTLIVIITAIITATFFGGADFLFTSFLSKFVL